MKLQLDLDTVLKKKIEGYNFEVGILETKPRRLAKSNGILGENDLTYYAGGPVRKTEGSDSKSNKEVFLDVQKQLGINLLSEPFKSKQNKDIVAFANYFMKFVFEKGNEKRLINLMQAIIRNPILRQDYGQNKASTADAKGFDRLLFDTGQLFKNIKARILNV